MDLLTKVILLMVRRKDVEFVSIVMVHFMLAIINKIKCMVKDCLNGQTAENIKVIGLKINFMVKARLSGLTDVNIVVSINKI